MRTLATACDGVVECLNSEDETWICTNRERPIWIVLGCLGLVLVVVVGLKFREMRRIKRNSAKVIKMSESTEKLIKTLENVILEGEHDKSDFWKILILLAGKVSSISN